jgi:hypothetical protein
LLIVGINGSISILVLNAFNRAQAEQDHRLEALRHVDDLRREMDTLSGLVRSYVVTCESRYLTYYYAILAIREGDQPPVTDAEPATFWSRVIAGTTPYDPRSERPRESVWARMRALGFEEAELSALERVRLEAEAIKALEQVAFAAAQGSTTRWPAPSWPRASPIRRWPSAWCMARPTACTGPAAPSPSRRSRSRWTGAPAAR